jgi:hypothetical protein
MLVGIMLVMLASIGFWSCYVLSTSRSNGSIFLSTNRPSVILYPESWLNKPFPLLDQIDNGVRIRTGQWLLVLYHYDCKTCLEAIPAYSFWAENAASDKKDIHLAFISIPPNAPQGHEPIESSPSYMRLSLRADYDWIATTPVVVAIKDGRVLMVREGSNAAIPPDVAW